MFPAVYKFIAFVNRNFATSKETRGNDKYLKHLKLMIAGGAAFNYYIKRTQKTKILDTHDFDLRLFLDIKPTVNPLFKQDKKEEMEQWMKDISSATAYSFTDFLNKYVYGLNIRGKHFFNTVDRGFLTTIEYTIDQVDSLIDIVPHIPSISIHYGALVINKDELFHQYKDIDFSGVASRSGFFKTSLIYTRAEPDIYYVSLGYLLWDTVRMLNFIIDSVNFVTKYDQTVKFERYLGKYKILLSALSNPELYMNCVYSRKFIKTCSKKPVCKIGGQKIKSRATLVKIGIENGIIPKDSKLGFADVCNIVGQLTL